MTDTDRTVALLRLLGHPVRLRILTALRNGPLSVSALQEATGAAQSAVSQQLIPLRGAGAVSCHRSAEDARIMLYALASDHVRAVLDAVQDP